MWSWNLGSKTQIGKFVQTQLGPLNLVYIAREDIRSGYECSKIWELAKKR